MSDNTYAIPAGSLVLVTGINGFVASHVADQLLKRGYRVRGTARSPEKLEVILKTLQARTPGANIEGVVIKDMQDEGAFTKAVQGVSGVIHLAADLSLESDPNKIIPAIISGARQALEAAAATETVKRVVFTSSVVTLPSYKSGVPGRITPSDWNDEAVKAAWAPPPYDPSRTLDVYAASKVESEKWVWKYVQEQKPSFAFNTVLPAMVLGPALDGANLSVSGYIKAAQQGEQGAIQFLRTLVDATWFVDVEDVAIVHVAALLEEDVKGERIFSFGESFTYPKIIEILKKIDPSRTDYPEPAPGPQENLVAADTSRGSELLKKYGGHDFRSLEQSLFNQFST